MAWIFAGGLVVLLSGLVVLLVVSPGLRMFCLGAVCMLGVVGVLLYMSHQHTTQEKTRERYASARSSEEAAGAGTEAAASWEQCYGTPGTQVAPTAQERPEVVSTPDEAVQAVQRLRAAHDMLRQDQEEPPALAMPQADVRPSPATTAPSPSRQSALSSEENDALALAGTPTAPAALTPRVTPIPRVTVIPPSSIPPRAPLAPPAIPTPSAVPTAPAPLTPQVTPTPSAPTSGSALKSCDALKAEIRAKLDAKSLTGYALTIMTSGDLQGLHVVGSCEGNTKKIVLNRSPNAP